MSFRRENGIFINLILMKISIQRKNMPVVAVVFNLQIITIIMFLYANYKSEHQV